MRVKGQNTNVEQVKKSNFSFSSRRGVVNVVMQIEDLFYASLFFRAWPC